MRTVTDSSSKTCTVENSLFFEQRNYSLGALPLLQCHVYCIIEIQNSVFTAFVIFWSL